MKTTLATAVLLIMAIICTDRITEYQIPLLHSIASGLQSATLITAAAAILISAVRLSISAANRRPK